MDSIVAVRYIDALYFKKSEKYNFTEFKTHVAVGWLVNYNTHITIIFNKKENIPESGLVIPKEALIFENQDEQINAQNFLFKKDSSIGVYWKDLIYFTNGKIPENPMLMYSEGKIFSITNSAVILKNPETVAVSKKNIKNHPIEKISFLVIPKLLVSNIEYYD